MGRAETEPERGIESGAESTGRAIVAGVPARDESAAYYHRYIDRVIGAGPDVIGILQSQREDTLAFLERFSEEQSRFRYAPGKWTAREVLSHVNDCERLFVFRAMWFARGFESPLPSFDQEVAAVSARADAVAWVRHVEEFRGIRLASEAFFGNLPEEAWSRRGLASDNPFTVRALAYVTAGHLVHHREILRERYLPPAG
ncbi:MAG TPA: DinB family protein [Thermoanaerobaculia bacterium]